MKFARWIYKLSKVQRKLWTYLHELFHNVSFSYYVQIKSLFCRTQDWTSSSSGGHGQILIPHEVSESEEYKLRNLMENKRQVLKWMFEQSHNSISSYWISSARFSFKYAKKIASYPVSELDTEVSYPKSLKKINKTTLIKS